jgi:hypothetical protein
LVSPCLENCPYIRRGRVRFLRAIRLGPEGKNAGLLQGKTYAREKKVKPCGKGFIPADITDGMQAVRGYFGFAAWRFSSFNKLRHRARRISN